MKTTGGIARTVGVLGHELRNPLAAALTGAALLRELVDADDPRRRVVDGVAHELQRMSALIDSYLDFARCGQAKKEPVSLAEVLAAAASRREGVTVDGALDATLVGDAALLERAFDNLIDNAFAAGAHNVRIDAQKERGGLVVSVEDDGPGVPPELRARIFDLGYSRHGSTGLGLGFVQQVLQAHRGSVACENGSRGARFVLKLPLAPACAEA